jgi:hypothetical protein
MFVNKNKTYEFAVDGHRSHDSNRPGEVLELTNGHHSNGEGYISDRQPIEKILTLYII